MSLFFISLKAIFIDLLEAVWPFKEHHAETTDDDYISDSPELSDWYTRQVNVLKTNNPDNRLNSHGKSAFTRLSNLAARVQDLEKEYEDFMREQQKK